MNVPLFSRATWCSPTTSWLTILSAALWIGGISLPTSVCAAQSNPSGDPVDKDVRYVNCSSINKRINSIKTALASVDPSENNTIYVRGACKENVNIKSFDRLTLIAQDGASITDASDGTLATISITDSTRVSIQGFTVNGNGSPSDQFAVINCSASTVYFSGNTVQGGGADAIDFFLGSRATFNGDVIQDAMVSGIFLGQNSTVQAENVTIQRITGDGVDVGVQSFFIMRSGLVQNNTGSGIGISLNGTTRLAHTTITGNTGDGIDVINHATLVLGGGQSSITGNRGVGILVKDLSFASFESPNVVKNNLGSKDVLCSPQFPATRGALTNIGGGTTNCIEP